MEFEIQAVTPAMAAEWLGRNTHNRRVRPNRVASLARDMVAGKWEMTGEPIKFAEDGSLLDGQHRLEAVVASGVTVTMVIATNVPKSAQSRMDSGARRTSSDALSLNGEKNTNLLAATVRIAIADRQGHFNGAPRSFGIPEVTHSEVLAFVDENPDVRQAVEHARRTARQSDCTPSIVAFTTWRLARINHEQAYKFWDDAANRIGLEAGDPILAMTARFADGRRRNERWAAAIWLSAVFRTWNWRRDHARTHILKMTSPNGGTIPIPVPR